MQKEDRERHALEEWLSPMSFQQFLSRTLSDRQEGTGSWLLESQEFTKWEGEVDESKTLLLLGNAGTGKTVLAATIAEHLRSVRPPERHTIFISGNLQDQLGREAKVEDFLLAVTKQLVQQLPLLPESVSAIWREHRYEAQPTSEEARRLLNEVLKQKSHFFFVIDALDEITPDVCMRLLSQLEILQREHSVKLLLTSRPHSHFELMATTMPTIDITARNAEIYSFVRDGILQLPCFVLESP